MNVKTTLVYKDNLTTDISDFDVKDLDQYSEAFLLQMKENNGIFIVGNQSKKIIINFAHVKHVIIEKCE